MYDDIRESESSEDRMKKTAMIYSFMCVAFKVNPKKTYELFFNSPTESTYYFYVSGIMGWFNFGDHFIAQVHKWQHMMEQIENQGLKLEHIDGTYVEFDSETEKEEFKKYVAEEEKKSIEALFSDIVLHIPFYVMKYYFDVNEENFEDAQRSIEIVKLIEMRLSNADVILNFPDMSDDKLLLYRLEWYLSICSSPKFDPELKHRQSGGVNIGANYEFYFLTFGLIKKALQIEFEEPQDFWKQAEELIILIEQQNERFATYGLSKEYILNYVPLSLEEHSQIKKSHWAKKADVWYSSVSKFISDIENPYAAYKLLLTFDYQKEFVSNSKIKKLLKMEN